MDKSTKHAIVIMAVAVAVIVAAFVGISKASGVSPFQTVVESGSMQHGIGSQIGVIDTGDMVVVKNKDSMVIQSFIDGYKTGYERFGNYGDVIIYNRGPDLNPVIHRAILWLDYNGNGTWSAPSLEGYPRELWLCSGSPDGDYMNLSGTLTLKNIGYVDTPDASINLDTLAAGSPTDGYLTKGDNNSRFDQPSSLAGVNGLISYDRIKSVAWFEIPWAGTFKMVFNGKTNIIDYWVPNTIPCIAASALLWIFLIVSISFLYDYRYYQKIKEELREEMNAPTPLFPVENKKE
ncbi:MAG: S26 family signal peptidase [Candidatus Methanoplasma sp.]|jgi:signal peptidase|nr:S26 family signal peptidase [Candidatus Methanoplasma sp.]